jgi:type I restriction enzyme, R subunit
VQQVVSNIDELRKALPVQVQKCLAFFPGVDRSVGGYEGLMAAQQCLPTTRPATSSPPTTVLGHHLGGALARSVPDPYEKDYKLADQVYESVKPPSGNGKLLWHASGAKTVS